MVYTDGTMEVIVSGKREFRLVKHVEIIHGKRQAIPEYSEHEMCIWEIGDDVPKIVKTSE